MSGCRFMAHFFVNMNLSKNQLKSHLASFKKCVVISNEISRENGKCFCSDKLVAPFPRQIL